MPRHPALLSLFFPLALLLSACSPTHLLLNRAADQLAAQGQAQEEDLELAREASAFYLKLSESLLSRTPDHLALGEAVAGGFTQYAYAFVAFEAERVEARDAAAAQRLRQRAARLYLRAHRHAMAVLEQRRPGFARALADGSLDSLAAEQVGLAYWAAASLGRLHLALQGPAGRGGRPAAGRAPGRPRLGPRARPRGRLAWPA